MAFGMMAKKFGILQWKYSGPKIRRTKKFMIAIARMHNFVMNERLKKNLKLDNTPNIVNFHQPTTSHNSVGVPLDGNSTMSTISFRRLQMVDWIKRNKNLKRPHASVLSRWNNWIHFSLYKLERSYKNNWKKS